MTFSKMDMQTQNVKQDVDAEKSGVFISWQLSVMFLFLGSSQLLEGVKTDRATTRKTKYFSISNGHLPSRKHLYQGQKTHISLN